jgi:hypothetical protein
MRGDEVQPAALFSDVQLEDRMPADHPLRVIRTLIDPLLVALSPRFDALYAQHGRPSIAPEQLLRALLLVAPGALYRPQRAPAQGAVPLQPALSLSFAGSAASASTIRPGCRPSSPRIAIGSWRATSRPRGSTRCSGSPRAWAAVPRAFHGRRHPARGLGESQELSPEG